MALNSHSAMFSQLPCLGVWPQLNFLGVCPRSFWCENFVECTLGVSIEIVADEDDLFAGLISSVQKFSDLDSPIGLVFLSLA